LQNLADRGNSLIYAKKQAYFPPPSLVKSMVYAMCQFKVRVVQEHLKILEDSQLADRLRRAALEWCARKRWSYVARRELRAYCSLR
jgi:hypothetical protein